LAFSAAPRANAANTNAKAATVAGCVIWLASLRASSCMLFVGGKMITRYVVQDPNFWATPVVFRAVCLELC